MKNLRLLLLVILVIGATRLFADDNKPTLTSRSPEVTVSIFGLKLLFGSMSLIHSVVVQVPTIAATLPVAGQNMPSIVSFSLGVGLISSAISDVVNYCQQNLPNSRINQ